MSKFFILRTEDRKGAKDDYIICVNPSIKKSKHLGRFAVLVHKRKIDKRLKELKVPCRVVIDETLGDREVRVDQSLRNALGIPYEFSDADKVSSPEIFDFINPTFHSPTTSSKSLNTTPNLASTGNLLQKASSGV